MQAGGDPCKSPGRRGGGRKGAVGARETALPSRDCQCGCQPLVSKNTTNGLFMRLGASRQLVALFAVVHGGAIACGFVNDLPLAIQCLVAIGVLLSARRCIALHGLRRGGRAIVLLIWDRHGQWRLLQRDGRVLDGHLAHGACAHPRLLVLPFRTQCGHRRCVLIAPDTVSADGMRRLRARLRCEPCGDP